MSLNDDDQFQRFKWTGNGRRIVSPFSWKDLRTAIASIATKGDVGPSAYDVAKSNGFTGTVVAWLSSLVGPKGDAGERGLQGLKGDAGERGLQGLKGDAGERGLQGLKGDAGERGLQGDSGAVGKSACEVAKANGFAGTQSEWLASMTPPRIERYTGVVVGTSGVATVTFPAFAVSPAGKVVPLWISDQEINGRVIATTTTTATVVVKRSRGTLALSTGPYEAAPAGTVVEIEVIGK